MKPVAEAMAVSAGHSPSQQPGSSFVEQGSLALAWLDHDYVPRCVLGDDLEIIWSNIAARSALAKRGDLEVRDRMLLATRPQHHAELLAFIHASGAGISTLCLPRSGGTGHLLLRAQRLRWTEEPAYGLSFFATGEDYSRRYADLDVAFGLTQAENKVLLGLLDGHDAEQLARRLDVSVATVRSHVRKIYEKMRVTSREALFRVAMPFSV